MIIYGGPHVQFRDTALQLGHGSASYARAEHDFHVKSLPGHRQSLRLSVFGDPQVEISHELAVGDAAGGFKSSDAGQGMQILFLIGSIYLAAGFALAWRLSHDPDTSDWPLLEWVHVITCWPRGLVGMEVRLPGWWVRWERRCGISIIRQRGPARSATDPSTVAGAVTQAHIW